jgi:hypothetical protein
VKTAVHARTTVTFDGVTLQSTAVTLGFLLEPPLPVPYFSGRRTPPVKSC